MGNRDRQKRYFLFGGERMCGFFDGSCWVAFKKKKKREKDIK